MNSKTRFLFLSSLIALVLSGNARAADKEAAVAADATQTASEKQLLLRAPGSPKNATGMTSAAFGQLVLAVEQVRFDVLDVAPDSPKVIEWCTASAAAAAQKNDDVTSKGAGRVTLEGLKARCSEVFQYDLVAKHSCGPEKKGKKRTCRIDIEVKVAKFEAKAVGGVPSLSPDKGFGKDGVKVIKADFEATAANDEDAQRDAAFGARLFAERDVREVPYFQVRSPVITADGPSASMCLGRDILELDQPFHIVKLNDKGEKVQVGFGKVREIYDGCVMTDPLQAKVDKGAKVVLKPAKLQTIIGRGDVRPGMTAGEMPSVGLDISLAAGVTSDAGDQIAPRVGMRVEYNLARHIGISELHAATHVGAVMVGKKAVQTVYDSLGITETAEDGGLAFQAEVGLLKRWYSGRFNVELGIFGAASIYKVGNPASEVELNAYGGAAKFGLGAQLAPRWALRFDAGYRYCQFSTVTIAGTEYTVAGTDLKAEKGVMADASLAYTW